MATIAKRRSRYAYGTVPGSNAYEGSAARRLERAPAAQPRPQVRPRERAVVRPRVRVREAGRVSVFAVAGFLAVTVCAVLLLWSYVELSQLSSEVVKVKSEITTLQSDEAKLRAQYELAYDLSDIEQTMTADGSMVRPGESQICYVDLSAPDCVELFDNETPVSGVLGLVGSVKEIFGEVVEYFR